MIGLWIGLGLLFIGAVAWLVAALREDEDIDRWGPR